MKTLLKKKNMLKYVFKYIFTYCLIKYEKSKILINKLY